MAITIKAFGTAQAAACDLITLTNDSGASMSVTNFGAHLVSIRVPDRDGNLGEVTLGQDDAARYADNDIGYMGATVGRYGNRIAGAAFMQDDVTYRLYANDGENTLHGGREGFNKKVFQYRVEGNSVLMGYTSPHMEEGFPGELNVTVRFTWDSSNAVKIDYEAVCDRDTQINLTNHAYFNLAGEGDIKGHTLQINADKVIAVDKDLIPTGKMLDVTGTPYDLRHPMLLGDALKRRSPAMFKNAKGFDIGYVLNGTGLRPVARLFDPASGRSMQVFTDQPGVQCYSGQGMDTQGRGGQHYGAYSGIALETQHHPDTVHHPEFGSTRLKVGEKYQTTTIYAFGIE